MGGSEQHKNKESGRAMLCASMKAESERKLQQHSSPPLRKSKNKRRQKEKEMLKEYIQELHKEREGLVNQWKEEFLRTQDEDDQKQKCWRRFGDKYIAPCVDSIGTFLSYLDIYISNMPLTIGAVGLSWVRACV